MTGGMAKEGPGGSFAKRWDSSSRLSFEKDPIAGYDVLPAERANSTGNLSQEEENKLLKRRIAQLEAENERLKASVFLLTEKLTKRKDFQFSMELLVPSSTANVPPPSLTPSPTIAPQTITNGRRFSNDVSAIHSKQSKEYLILEDDLSDASHSSESYVQRSSLSGHEGAVYQCRFSAEGLHLASTGLDGTVRIWTTGSGTDSLIGSHGQSASDVSWMSPTTVASSSFDLSVKLWDVAKPNAESPITSLSTNGLPMCLDVPVGGISTVVVGTNLGSVQMFDTRSSSTANDGSILLNTEGAVNAVCCGMPNIIICGDSKGYLRAFDSRMTGHQDLFVIQDNRPISGIAWSPSGLLAVNSYDNALRVFIRDNSGEGVKVIHTLRGHKSKNQPIRSSFSHETPTCKGAVSVATGSIIKGCYVFSPVTIPCNGNADDYLPAALSSQMLQGHNGTVFSCDFSPENLLAACSMDGTISLWSRKGQ